MESLNSMETADGEVRILANTGSLRVVFPNSVWERVVAAGAADFGEPTPGELAELWDLKARLAAYAGERGFGTVAGGIPCGGEGSPEYDLVLRPAGLLAVTVGYHFAPVVRPDLMARIGVGLEEDPEVEQAYVIGGVATRGALAAGAADENLKALSVRGRACSASRFEMPPELWHALSEGLGWRDVETVGTADAGR